MRLVGESLVESSLERSPNGSQRRFDALFFLLLAVFAALAFAAFTFTFAFAFTLALTALAFTLTALARTRLLERHGDRAAPRAPAVPVLQSHLRVVLLSRLHLLQRHHHFPSFPSFSVLAGGEIDGAARRGGEEGGFLDADLQRLIGENRTRARHGGEFHRQLDAPRGLLDGDGLQSGRRGAVLLHERDGVGEAAVLSELQRRGAVENGSRGADSSLQAELDRGEVLGADGEVEEVPAAGRRGEADVEAVLDQKAGYFGVAADHREDERVAAELRVRNARETPTESTAWSCASESRSTKSWQISMEPLLAARRNGVIPLCVKGATEAHLVAGGQIGARIDEQLHCSEVVVEDCEVQRRRAQLFIAKSRLIYRVARV